MSLTLISAAAKLESSDEFHEARILLLLLAASGKGEAARAVDGIMKLAKMDFLLRYPNILARALTEVKKTKPRVGAAAERIPEDQRNTIEGRMIRFRYGPWDKRYRRWLAILAAKNLLRVSKEGRTVKVLLTEDGRTAARKLATHTDFIDLAERANIVYSAVGHLPSEKVKDFIYKITPELLTMKWGEFI